MALIWLLAAVRRIFSKPETAAQLRCPNWGSTSFQAKGRWTQAAWAEIISASPPSSVFASRNAPKVAPFGVRVAAGANSVGVGVDWRAEIAWVAGLPGVMVFVPE